MRLTPTAEEAAFRDEVRGFLADSLPAALSHRVKHGLSVSRDDLQAWQAVLQARGWLAPNWPEEHGGTGWGVMRRHIFDLECRLANAPQTHGFNFGMLGPAIVRFGSEAQKSYYLPRILRGEDWWCQGYSEPEAGSDLASLRTRAERDGDDYLVNGGKIWTSFAEQANRIFCLVRTDPDAKPQQGISFLLIDLDSPGIEIRPLLAMNGRRLWNQVIFDDVRVPVDNRLGEENRGWTVAKRLLGDERIMVSRVSENKRLLALLQEVAAAEPCAGGLLIDDGEFRRRIAGLERRLTALEMSSLRLLSQAEAGRPIGAEPSMLKLLGSQLVQAMDEALCAAVGYFTAPDNREYLFHGANEQPLGPAHAVALMSNYLHHRGFTIAGGSTEVQYNILAKQTLEL